MLQFTCNIFHFTCAFFIRDKPAFFQEANFIPYLNTNDASDGLSFLHITWFDNQSVTGKMINATQVPVTQGIHLNVGGKITEVKSSTQKRTSQKLFHSHYTETK